MEIKNVELIGGITCNMPILMKLETHVACVNCPERNIVCYAMSDEADLFKRGLLKKYHMKSRGEGMKSDHPNGGFFC